MTSRRTGTGRVEPAEASAVAPVEPAISSALTRTVRSTEVSHPVLAFIERSGGDRSGVTLPPGGGPPTKGPTSGQWGSG